MSSAGNLTAALEKFTKAKTNYIRKQADVSINKALHKLGKETRDKIREYITNGWYSTYTPRSYHRTHDLWESVTYVVSGHTVRVYFDMRKLRGKMVNGGKGWQPHRNFSIPNGHGGYTAGVDFTTGLVSWIEDGGKGGGSPKNPRAGHNGVHMIKQTQEWLNGYLDKETKKIIGEILKKSGLSK